jgi:hypothetical protein
MDLFQSHFMTIEGNLCLNPSTGTYEMFPESREGKIGLHINYTSFEGAFEYLTKMKDPVILETGSSRWGTNSTVLFDSYIRYYGGRLWSVDIDEPTINMVRQYMSPSTTMVCNDSVTFLREWVASNPGVQANFVYLDSWDIEWRNPGPAEEHGLAEFNAILPALRKGSVVLIDDTPASPYWTDDRGDNYAYLSEVMAATGQLPGKGRLVINMLADNPRFRKIHHMYQVMYECIAD